MHRRNNFIGPALPLLLFLFLSYTAPGQDQQPVMDTVVVGSEDASVTSDSFAQDSSEASHLEAAVTDSFLLRSLPDTTVQRWKRDPVFAYANDPAYWRREVEAPQKENSFLLWLGRLFDSDGFRYFLYILVGAALVYFIFRVINDNNLRLFYRQGKKQRVGEEQPVSELEEDLDKHLQHFLELKDYRQATRYLYLITLRLLDQKGLIQWQQETTNREYLRQLSGSAMEEPFRYLTGAYERVWYGEFLLAEPQFIRLHRYFEEFYKTVTA